MHMGRASSPVAPYCGGVPPLTSSSPLPPWCLPPAEGGLHHEGAKAAVALAVAVAVAVAVEENVRAPEPESWLCF